MQWRGAGALVIPVFFSRCQSLSLKTQNALQLDIRRKSRIVREWQLDCQFPGTAKGLQPNYTGKPCQTLWQL